MMGLSPVPSRFAPGFDLTDQGGHPTSLASFKGEVVVLTFMDSHCVDICPLVSQEFIDAYHDLGPAAGHVVLVAVNVNPHHAAISDVAEFSAAHGLGTISSWRFVTGPVSMLQQVWSAYNVDVETSGSNAQLIHSSLIYFIDPTGRERYLAAPTDDHTASGASFLPARQLLAWGQGIAEVARTLGS
jgi:cytochrome oxidase Cu insertion factor (SCO1/SenC/PrrC family)